MAEFFAGMVLGAVVVLWLMDRHLTRLQRQFDEAIRIASDALAAASLRSPEAMEKP